MLRRDILISIVLGKFLFLIYIRDLLGQKRVGNQDLGWGISPVIPSLPALTPSMGMFNNKYALITYRKNVSATLPGSSPITRHAGKTIGLTGHRNISQNSSHSSFANRYIFRRNVIVVRSYSTSICMPAAGWN